MRFVCRAAVVVSMCALACNRPPQTLKAPEFRGSIAGVDWSLMELGGKPAPTGAGGQRVTIHFDADSGRVFGFAGCNRFAGGYTVEGSNLHFPPLAMTKMACTEGMELEQQFADALIHTNRYEFNAAGLTFFDGSTPLARFTRANQ
ncbi:MAG TPA: META domain-containing protein [Gemmatimonadaceae bacterium]|nr:META domain-containing protein [Gemmatimonadaceae bacterium]